MKRENFPEREWKLTGKMVSKPIPCSGGKREEVNTYYSQERKKEKKT